jgi:hypothetical protein
MAAGAVVAAAVGVGVAVAAGVGVGEGAGVGGGTGVVVGVVVTTGVTGAAGVGALVEEAVPLDVKVPPARQARRTFVAKPPNVSRRRPDLPQFCKEHGATWHS